MVVVLLAKKFLGVVGWFRGGMQTHNSMTD